MTLSSPDRPPPPGSTGTESGALDDIFAALSDPIRRGIVVRLSHGSCSVSELGAPFAVSAPAISKHLAVLQRGGLIERWKLGRVHYCRLRTEPLAQAGTWIEQHRAFWQGQLDSLADYLDRETSTCEPSGTGTQP